MIQVNNKRKYMKRGSQIVTNFLYVNKFYTTICFIRKVVFIIKCFLLCYQIVSIELMELMGYNLFYFCLGDMV